MPLSLILVIVLLLFVTILTNCNILQLFEILSLPFKVIFKFQLHRMAFKMCKNAGQLKTLPTVWGSDPLVS